MLFNSFEFIVFMPLVFFFYWFVVNKHLQLQNILVLVASYVFYGWWDWRFLSLIFLSTVVDYFVGRGMERTTVIRSRKLLLVISLAVNLGALAVFKYFNFFTESFISMFASLGVELQAVTLNVILPVGISFYTFQTLSYSIDVYRKKLKPSQHFIEFAAFVSFFPQLVAGPIERATNLLPQFSRARVFNYEKAVDGCRQILWGLFKKMVIADNCAYYVNKIFSDPSDHSGSTLLVGAIFFAFQIYGDFSGYSDIAIGTARLLGFDLMRNFAFPYFSRDIAEFWRRWHISLSTWFRDYLYIPLGGNSGGKLRGIRNVCIVFTVSGFWHGASWNFIVWGLFNGLLFLPLFLFDRNRAHLNQVAEEKLFPSLREVFQMGLTFFLTLNAWVLFRTENLTQSMEYFSSLYSKSLFSMPEILPTHLSIALLGFVVLEWLNRDKQHVLEVREQEGAFRLVGIARWPVYFVFILLVLGCGGEQQEFIYFDF